MKRLSFYYYHRLDDIYTVLNALRGEEVRRQIQGGHRNLNRHDDRTPSYNECH